jgi:hypothetical protein
MMPIFYHTPDIDKQIVIPIVASHATNIMLGANCRFVKPQNGPTFHEHVIQGLHATLGMVLPMLTHLSTLVIKNYLPIGIVSPCGQLDLTPWVLIPLELHLPIDMS